MTAVSSKLKKGRLCQIPSDKKSEIISFLQNYCEGKPIVWSAVAKQFNLTTTNGGHMVKQFTVRSGLNVESLQCKKGYVLPRNRVHKKRTSDSKVPVQVPVPCKSVISLIMALCTLVNLVRPNLFIVVSGWTVI